MSRGLGHLERKILAVLPKIAKQDNFTYSRFCIYRKEEIGFGATVSELTHEIFGVGDKKRIPKVSWEKYHCSVARAVKSLGGKGAVDTYFTTRLCWSGYRKHKEVFVRCSF